MQKKIIAIIILLMLGVSAYAKNTQDSGLLLRIDAHLGGGYDANLFREAYPLTDDFDYPAYQPDITRKSELLDVNTYVNIGYFLPETPLWKKSKISLGFIGAYNRVAEQAKDSNQMMENYYQWGIEGDWYIKFTGTSDDEGIFAIVNNTYKRTGYTDADNYLDDNSPDTPRDSYNYAENVFKIGIGYMGHGMPPVGAEYKLYSRTSPEKQNGENYAYEPGPVAIKVYTGFFAGYMRISDMNIAKEKNYDPYKQSLNLSGVLLRLAGEYWSREYTSYQARDLDGSLDDANPLLVETRRYIEADLHIGSMLVRPIFDVKQKSGINVHYQYYKNEDDYEQYYDYIWNRGWVAAFYTIGVVHLSAKYEHHIKTFRERTITMGTDKRKDVFQVASAHVDFMLKNLTIAAQYSYTNANSNEDAVYLNYNKHYAYLKVDYFLDKHF